MPEAEIDTKRLRELAKAATSGPWFKWPESNHVCERAQHTIVAACPGKDGDKRWEWGTVHHPEVDAEFIAAANPTAILSLLDRIEELQAEAFKWHKMAAACEGFDEPPPPTPPIREQPHLRNIRGRK